MNEKPDLMPIKQWVDEVLLATSDIKVCFILLNDDWADGDTYALSVELPHDQIAGVYPTETKDFELALSLKEALALELRSRGIEVYTSGLEWATYLGLDPIG